MTTYTNGIQHIAVIANNKEKTKEELECEILSYNKQVSPAGQIPLDYKTQNLMNSSCNEDLPKLVRMYVDRTTKIKLLMYNGEEDAWSNYKLFKYYGNGNNVELKRNHAKKSISGIAGCYYMILGKRHYLNHLINDYEWNNVYNYVEGEMPPTTQEVIENEVEEEVEAVLVDKEVLTSLIEQQKTLYNKNIEMTIALHKVQLTLEALMN